MFSSRFIDSVRRGCGKMIRQTLVVIISRVNCTIFVNFFVSYVYFCCLLRVDLDCTAICRVYWLVGSYCGSSKSVV